MPRELDLPPSAASLSASMRDIGYSLETAVADLIDNSISAHSSTIEILCDLTNTEPTLVILDDGKGMSQNELISSMRHGAINPKRSRDSNDLGRFGLGLKTASFSQCRRLTVISSINEVRSAAEWDLDVIDRKDKWCLLVPDFRELETIPFFDRIGKNGTMVVWRSLDRIFEDETVRSKKEELVFEKLDVVEKHLSLVFHRFLSGEVKRKNSLKISINGHNIEPFDPFCRKNSATQTLPEETIDIDGEKIRIQPYILPHHSKLTKKEYDYYLDRNDFLSNQGAYIYRNHRLMAWGDWFRFVPKGEATKLARVQIDFPSSLDESWTIDIKKSRAKPPPVVRESFRRIISNIVDRSVRVHRGRGEKLYEKNDLPIWERYADQGSIRYSLNSAHPLIEAINSNLQENDRGNLLLLLQTVSSSLPVEMIYSDYSTYPKSLLQEMQFSDENAVVDKLRTLKHILFGNKDGDSDKFRKVINSMRAFDSHTEILDNFINQEFV